MSKSAAYRLLPLLLIMFVGSGAAALIYEIVWFQLLQLVIGSSAISLGVLLGTFMGGMCLGSLLLPRWIPTSYHPLRIYAALELSIGIIGVAVLMGVPLIGGIYTEHASHGFSGFVLRGALAALFLIPPTLMMGGTLPAIARWIETTREGISWLGFFYAGNIIGAVMGCVLAGFYLLRVFDMTIATAFAAAINVAVAIAGFRLSNRAPHKVSVDNAGVTEPIGLRKVRLPVYVAVGLSGLSALGAEAVWTRQLSLVFGATVYAFTIILAVFLVGLGIGSSTGSYVARSTPRPRMALAVCQILLVPAIAWAAWAIAYSLPYWPIDFASITNPWEAFRIDMIRCLWSILPAACLWGASFPLALASVASPESDPGRLVGGLYAANTLGAIVGALAFSTFVVPWIGSHHAQQLLLGVVALSGVIVLVVQTRSKILNWGSLTAVALFAVLLGWSIPPLPGLLVAYGREFPVWVKNPPAVRYVGEGMNSAVAVTEWPSGVRSFHVSGKIEASSAARDMRLERMLGHLSALLHPNPKSILIVGFGAGVTAGSFVLHPGIERIVICEIEPLIPKQVATYFKDENYDVLHDPRVEVVYDDARHYVLTTREKFDVITSDPIHPWVKGAATLYSTEYFEKVKQHLNPGGVVSQWVPLYDSTEDVVKSEVATFFQTFPNGTIWNSDLMGKGYDTVLIGQNGPARIDLDALSQRMARSDHRRVVESLEDVKFTPALSILATYSGSAVDLRRWLQDAEINTDRNLRLQYLAGLVMNLTEADRIYSSLRRYWRFPDEMFVGSPVLKEGLRLALMDSSN